MLDSLSEKLKFSIEREVFLSAHDYKIIDDSNNPAEWIMDFRKVIIQPEILSITTDLILQKIRDANITSYQVAGVETAAIPLITGVVMKSVQDNLSINGFYIRKSRKKTGLLNMVEGKPSDAPVVLLDDLINSGSSLRRVVELLEESEKKVEAIVVLLRFRDLSYYKYFIDKKIKVISLFSLNDFTETLGIKNKEVIHQTKPFDQFKPLWGFKSGNPSLEYVVPKSTPTLSEGLLYFGSDNGTFYALEAKSGKVVWTYKIIFGAKGKMIFSSPTICGGMVFFGGYDGNFYALDKRTGELVWKGMDCDWIGSSPCVSLKDRAIFVGAEYGFWKKKGGIVAYDLYTGKLKWRFDSSEYTHGSPAYSKSRGLVICGSNDGKVYAVDSAKGTLRWVYDAKGEVKAACSLSPNEKYVAFGSFNKNIVVLETTTGKEVMIFSTLEANYSTPAWDTDKFLVATSLDKRVYKFDIEEKSKVWEFVTPSRIFASPTIVDKRVFFGNNSAALYVLDLETGKQVGYHQTIERITNAVVPDIENDRFFIMTYANEIIALSPLKFQ